MSLIPSESSSFADLLGRGLDGSKKSKWREPVTEAPTLSDPPKSPPRSPVLKEKPQPEQVTWKAPTAPASRKVEAKKPLAMSKKKESVPLLAPVALEPVAADPIAVEPIVVEPSAEEPIAAEPIPPVIEPELKEETLPPLIPLSDSLPVESVVVPEPVPPSQAVQPPQPVLHEPMIKAPLVIQPEDEPPRRPIPIVRVARSKQDPHGNGRGMITETNGHDILPPPPPPSPAPMAVTFAPPAQRLRPKPLVRPRLEEEPPAPHALRPVPREQIEAPQNVGQMPPSAMNVDPDPAESDPWWTEEAARTSEPRPRLRFQIQWGSRLMRFLTYEAAAILVLLGAVLLGLAHRAPDDPLNLLTRILAIGAAIVAAVIPVLFYGLPERFPRDPR
jgi:hypothetical protein